MWLLIGLRLTAAVVVGHAPASDDAAACTVDSGVELWCRGCNNTLYLSPGRSIMTMLLLLLPLSLLHGA